MNRKCIICGYEYGLHMAMGNNCPKGNGKWKDTVFVTEEYKSPKLQAEIAILRDALERIFEIADRNVSYEMDLSGMARIKDLAKEALKEKE